MAKHRRFFDRFAIFKKFDPLIAEKWYPITRKDISNAVCFAQLQFI
jgi:hypothetical protein